MRPAPGPYRVRATDASDVAAVRSLTAAAFASATHRAPPADDSGQPGEAALVQWLLEGPDTPPGFSLVAEAADGTLLGHGVASRGDVEGAPALGLGPVSVLPAHQGTGVGSTLVRALLAAAEQMGESVVCLLGDPAYYARFGFRPAAELGIAAPDPRWGALFQALALGTAPTPEGAFHYAPAFDRL